MTNVTRLVFEDYFKNILHLPHNNTCNNCSPKFKNPMLPWIVGSKFDQADDKILFVGKPHRGRPGTILLPSEILDPTDEVNNGLWNKAWPYWSYTREICERIYGEGALDYISFSNIVKCSNTDADDSTTEGMMNGCVNKLGVIWKEIAILKAKNVVFYTYSLYRDAIRDIQVAIPGSIIDVTTDNHRVACGNKTIGWWEREFSAVWSDKVRLLVTGHPERMKKASYVDLVSNWIMAGR